MNEESICVCGHAKSWHSSIDQTCNVCISCTKFAPRSCENCEKSLCQYNVHDNDKDKDMTRCCDEWTPQPIAEKQGLPGITIPTDIEALGIFVKYLETRITKLEQGKSELLPLLKKRVYEICDERIASAFKLLSNELKQKGK